MLLAVWPISVRPQSCGVTPRKMPNAPAKEIEPQNAGQAGRREESGAIVATPIGLNYSPSNSADAEMQRKHSPRNSRITVCRQVLCRGTVMAGAINNTPV